MAESYHLSQMSGMRRPRWHLFVLAFFSAFAQLGCNKSVNPEGTTAAGFSSEKTPPRSGKLSRSELACRLHSCAPPYFCNQQTGVCERLPCFDSGDCPYDYKCDFAKKVCQ
jgi:hypothetical protein